MKSIIIGRENWFIIIKIIDDYLKYNKETLLLKILLVISAALTSYTKNLTYIPSLVMISFSVSNNMCDVKFVRLLVHIFTISNNLGDHLKCDK